MPRYVAFLRGVSPSVVRNADLKRAFESAGFTNVKTVLSSGNVVFDAPRGPPATLARRAEAAMAGTLGRSFDAIVRPVSYLRALLVADPFARHGLPARTRRVVTFLREAGEPRVPLPHSAGKATVLHVAGTEAFTAYEPADEGPVFMRLIEQAFGKAATTRTVETVRKCAES